jgi:hypothetical protein
MHEAVESWRVRINLDSEISWRAAREAIVPAAFSEGPVQLSVLKEGGEIFYTIMVSSNPAGKEEL